MTDAASNTQVFAVLRLDFYDDPQRIVIERDPSKWGAAFWGVPAPSCITGTKGYLAREEAQAEAARLNLVNADKSCHYIVTIVRLAGPAL